MNPNGNEDLEQIFQRMGASPEQSVKMARHLKKRAEQLAEERKITEVEAMSHLLQLMTAGSKS